MFNFLKRKAFKTEPNKVVSVDVPEYLEELRLSEIEMETDGTYLHPASTCSIFRHRKLGPDDWPVRYPIGMRAGKTPPIIDYTRLYALLL